MGTLLPILRDCIELGPSHGASSAHLVSIHRSMTSQLITVVRLSASKTLIVQFGVSDIVMGYGIGGGRRLIHVCSPFATEVDDGAGDYGRQKYRQYHTNTDANLRPSAETFAGC